MKRSKLRINPKLKNHAVFQKHFSRWKKGNSLNEVESFHTRDFSPDQFYKPLELASIENLSISSACLYYRSLGLKVPSSETLLDCCQREGDDRMEIHINHLLEDFYLGLPGQIRRLFRRWSILIVDFHQDLYYGDPDNPNIRKVKPKRSTNMAYCYLTADLYTPKGKVTIACVHQKPGMSVEMVFSDLLARVELILTPKLIIFDGEFTNVKIMDSLKRKGISFIGRKSISKRLRPLALAYSLTDNWEELRKWHAMKFISNDHNFETLVHVTFHRVGYVMKAIAISPDLDLTPEEVEQWYSKRFNIESGYRDKHLFQARTTSKILSIRYLILAFAFIFWNLWQIFLMLVSCAQNYSLNRVSKWRRELRTIKLFLLRDIVL